MSTLNTSNKKILILATFIGIILIAGFYLATQRRINPTSIIKQNNGEVLLTIESTGGLCPYGGCYSQIEIYENGSYTYKEGNGKKSQGELATDDINSLERLVKDTIQILPPLNQKNSLVCARPPMMGKN